jgi:hypothetical protein
MPVRVHTGVGKRQRVHAWLPAARVKPLVVITYAMAHSDAEAR